MNSIEAFDLVKSFNGLTAVENLSFNVEEGEIFGLLGPNGAGKTTTIRMLSALISPTSGRAIIGGYDVQDDALKVREIIGILTESPSLYGRLTAMENMEFFAKAYGVTDKAARDAKIHELLDFFQLWDRRGDPVGQYSKGMKQKLAIARSLIHSPEILYLDEPTSGLDPKSSKDIRDLMEELTKNERQTILLCTHRLEDAEKLCDRVMIINKGRPITISSPRDLRKRFSSGQEVQIGVTRLDDGLVEMVRSLPNVVNLTANHAENSLSVSLGNEQDTPSLVKALVEHGVGVRYVKPLETSLEEAYLELMEEAQ
ncbi:ABC transporter ATP-binding protein [Candidatus Bathyarchaeota archaeon]|nr:ABC transporter ATP-binding protein [Candidatus Bathyarchaeota archaeon]